MLIHIRFGSGQERSTKPAGIEASPLEVEPKTVPDIPVHSHVSQCLVALRSMILGRAWMPPWSRRYMVLVAAFLGRSDSFCHPRVSNSD